MRVRRLPRGDEATLVEHVEELRQRVLVAIGAIAVGDGGRVPRSRPHPRPALPPPAAGASPSRHLRRRRAVLGVAVGQLLRRTRLCIARDPVAGVVVLRTSPSIRAERRILGFAAFGALSPPRGSPSASTSCSPVPCTGSQASTAGNFHILIRASSYFSFVTSVLVGVALVFELPLVVVSAVSLGILTSSTLRRNRRLGYVIVAAIALALPGPDPVTTMFELLPMWALFEGSIWLAVLTERRAARVRSPEPRHDQEPSGSASADSLQE